jgi:hypothetical protein
MAFPIVGLVEVEIDVREFVRLGAKQFSGYAAPFAYIIDNRKTLSANIERFFLQPEY